MNLTLNPATLIASLKSFSPDTHVVIRCLSLYSAAIAFARDDLLAAAIDLGRKHGVTRDQFYEIILQSYLFLGFPRMLEAADHLNRYWPAADRRSQTHKISTEESLEWFSRGTELYASVYREAGPLLQRRVEAFAPEVFRWMIVEGYGKVLSRGGLSPVDRELAIVSSLMIENRPRQLHSHLRGALNVGAPPELVRTVVEDIGDAAGDGYASAVDILDRLGGSQ